MRSPKSKIFYIGLSILCLSSLLLVNGCDEKKDESPAEKLIPEAAASAQQIVPLKTGDRAPNIAITSVDGDSTNLHSLLAKNPLVVIFYRGGWCPYCNQQLAELRTIASDLNKIGYKLVAISPDTPAKLAISDNKHDLPYTLYADQGLLGARQFGVAFQVPKPLIEKLDKKGISLSEYAGDDHHLLPVPSIFVIDRAGIVVYRYANPDYKVRLDAQELLKVVKQSVRDKSTPTFK